MIFLTGDTIDTPERHDAAIGTLSKPHTHEALLHAVAFAGRIENGDASAETMVIPQGLTIF